MKRKREGKTASGSGPKTKKKKKSPATPKNDQKPKYVTPHLPQKAEEMSSNWKALQSILMEEKNKNSDKSEKTRKPKKFLKSLKNLKEKEAKKIKDKEGISFNTNNKSNEIWFDDVDVEDIEKAGGKVDKSEDGAGTSVNLTIGGYQGLTKKIAIDCEFVGVGSEGAKHMLARVSIVNSHGRVVYDKYVAPEERVIDYRTAVSGIRSLDLKDAPDFKTVQKEVSDILQGRIVIGHALKHDLQVLFLAHPRKDIRDTSKYKPFQKIVQSKHPSLKKLSKEILHSIIQEGEHCSIQDAQAAMRLYCLHKREWEKQIKDKKFHFSKKRLEQDAKGSS